MISTLREPVAMGYYYQTDDGIRADTNACVILCAHQMLYAFGKIDEEECSLAAINQRLGRDYDDPEEGHATSILHENGLLSHSIGPDRWADVDRWIKSYEDWLEEIKSHHPDEDVRDDEITREAYSRWLVYIDGLLENRDRYRHLSTEKYREPVMADIDHLLSEGYLVVIDVDVDPTGVICGVVYSKDGDSYRIHHPAGHLMEMTAEEILAVNGDKLDNITGWKPSSSS